MLRTNFTKGLTNLTMLTADEQAGVILTILIIAQLDERKRLLAENFQADAEDVVMLPLYTNDDTILLDDESEEVCCVVHNKNTIKQTHSTINDSGPVLNITTTLYVKHQPN
jgi:hypothetical protein